MDQYAWKNMDMDKYSCLPVLTNALVHMFSVCLFSSSQDSYAPSSYKQKYYRPYKASN